LYPRISANDQQALATQNRTMLQYATQRGWIIAHQVREKTIALSGEQPVRSRSRPHADGYDVRPEAVNCSE